MNLLQRLISHVVPPKPAACDHEPELRRLRERLEEAARARSLAATASADIQANLESRLAAAKVTIAQLRGEVDELNHQRSNAWAREQDLVGQLEQTTAAIAVLETKLREVGVKPEQLALGVGAGSAAPADEAPQPDEEFSNALQSLAFRLVGIFFDDDGPGRRHHWLMERAIGELTERVKVPISDAEFLKRVSLREEAFGAGDTLVGDFRVITWRSPANGALRVEYRALEKVHRIVHPDKQIPLIPADEEVAHV